MSPDPAVIWHDVECGAYRADLPLWRALAAEHGGPILDIGAGTGRVTLDLARLGSEVTALDSDPRLLRELTRRARDLPVTTAAADAREFALGRQFALIIAPMQTIQLLDGADGRLSFLRCARSHLRSGGCLAMALTEAFDLYSPGPGQPLLIPDVRRAGGALYASRPTAVRSEGDTIVLERSRQLISREGRTVTQPDVVRLSRLTASQLEAEAEVCGLRPQGRTQVPATADHVGSVVVMAGG